MILTFFLFVAAQTPPQNPEWEVDSFTSEILGDQVIYRAEGLRYSSEDRSLSADIGVFTFDKTRYKQITQHGISQGLEEKFLGGLASPADDLFLQLIELTGHVVFIQDQLQLQCQSFTRWPQKSESLALQAKLTFPSGGRLNGWPWSLACEELKEFADGSLVASRCEMTTCSEQDAHYSLSLNELKGKRSAPGDYLWDPSSAWLKVLGVPLLPLPAPVFGGDDSGFGLDLLHLLSGRQWGTGARIGFSSSEPMGPGELHWWLRPAWSSERGFPVIWDIKYEQPGFSSGLELFYLDDQGEDIHPFRNQVGRNNTIRSRIRWDNRWELNHGWWLDADLSLTSDPLVDPEFFRQEWIENENAESELYLHRHNGNLFVEVAASARLDSVGYTPLEGFDSEGLAPTPLELLPSLHLQQFPTELFAAKESSWNWSWDLQLARMQLRPHDLVPAPGSTPFQVADVITRDRAQWKTHLSFPWSLGPLRLQAGFQTEGGFWKDPKISSAPTQGRSFGEADLSMGMILLQEYEGGWSHQVHPHLRLFDRHQFRESHDIFLNFDELDQLQAGRAVELGLRQLWFEPGNSSPWLDVNLLAPRFIDPDNTWGPLELRATWSPLERSALLGKMSASARVRHAFDEGDSDQLFASLSMAPLDSWRLTAGLREVGDEFQAIVLRATASITDSWQFQLGRTFVGHGNAAKSTLYGLTYQGHDFFFTLQAIENEATGDKKIQFDLMPLFLAKNWQPGL